MTTTQDRLFHLLPYVYRLRDAERGDPLRRFLSVVEEQVSALEADLERTYDNWFIETCEDWVVPYIAELLGYRALAPAGASGVVQRAEGRLLRRTLAARVDVASTMAHARRKGTLPLLEELARVVAGYPAHAAEGARRLSHTQAIRHLRLERGRTFSVRDGAALDTLGGAFDASAHGLDVRRPGAAPQGLCSVASVGVFVWRLRAFPITRCEPYFQEGAGVAGRGCFWFNVLGFDAPLFVRPLPEPDAYTLSGPEHVPTPLGCAQFERDLLEHDPRTGVATLRAESRFYGEGKSLCIWLDRGDGLKLVPREQIIAADLSNWKYPVREDCVLVDPERGRFKVAGRTLAARVSYHAGCSSALGGGEYDRELATPSEPHRCYVVGSQPGQHATLADAVAAWERDMEARRAGDATIVARAIIEVTARGTQRGRLHIQLGEGETLIVRAADRNRVVLWLSDNQPEASDAISVTGAPRSRFVLDGVLIAQRGIELQGVFDQVILRHCTVPPQRVLEHREGSISNVVLNDVSADVLIERCVLGQLTVSGEGEPTRLDIRDSIIDAGHDQEHALSGDGEGSHANATLRVRNSTLFGASSLHAIELAENTIFSGLVRVARRQPGCLRFCYAPQGSRTPRRYQCQPDLVLEAAHAESDALQQTERERVRPLWTSRRYGAPGYAQLSRYAAPELKRGADDESELGVFHDLYAPQREDALRTRLEDYAPVAIEPGIFFQT